MKISELRIQLKLEQQKIQINHNKYNKGRNN